jgi:hypothetical protein
MDSGKNHVGILTSSPQYNLDIRGNLYYSGSFLYDTQATRLSFSTQKENIFFSTILYSSITVRNELLLPENDTYPTSRFLALGTNDTRLFKLSERQLPQTWIFSTSNNQGIYVNSNYSTIDINYNLITYNNTRNVGIYTIEQNVLDDFTFTNSFPSTLPSSYDLVVNGTLSTRTILASTLDVFTKLTFNNLEMPTLGINPSTVSTFHTIVPSFSNATYNTILKVDNFVELFKDNTLQGSMHSGRPVDASYTRSLFNVYTDAFISTVTVNSLHTTGFLLGAQDL